MLPAGQRLGVLLEGPRLIRRLSEAIGRLQAYDDLTYADFQDAHVP
jgi:hypothetical protein